MSIPVEDDPTVKMGPLKNVTEKAVGYLAGTIAYQWSWQQIDEEAFEKSLHYILDWAPPKLYYKGVLSKHDFRSTETERRVIEEIIERLRNRRAEVLAEARAIVIEEANRLVVRVRRDRIEIVGLRR